MDGKLGGKNIDPFLQIPVFIRTVSRNHPMYCCCKQQP